MSEYSIILSGEQVRDALDGRMTQIRIPVKPQPYFVESSGRWVWDIPKGKIEKGYCTSVCTASREWYEYLSRNQWPYRVGDRLWVKETFWAKNETCDHEYCSGCDLGSMLELGEGWCPIDYVATPACFNPPAVEMNQTVEHWKGKPEPVDWWLAPPDDWDGEDEEKRETHGVWSCLPWGYYTKHPSTHMPRWASRLDLIVKGIRCEQLQDIKPHEVIASGISPASLFGYDCDTEIQKWNEYISMWDHKYKKRGLGWKVNPWTWVIDFEMVKKLQKNLNMESLRNRYHG